MTLAIEILLFVCGISALVVGKLKFGKGQAVRGAAARYLGALSMLPLTMAFSFGVAIGSRARRNAVDLNDQIAPWALLVAELSYILFCLAVIVGSVGLISQLRRRHRRRVKEAEEEEREWDERRSDNPARISRRDRRDFVDWPTPPRTLPIIGGAYVAVVGVGLILGFYGLSRVSSDRGNRPELAQRPDGLQPANPNQPFKLKPEPANPNQPFKLKPENDRAHFALPPLPAPIAIRPPPIDRTTTIKLPSNIEGIAAGGGGRFLILSLPGSRQLAIFDCNEAKVLHTIPFAENVLAAAGMTKLIVLIPTKNEIQRWDLQSGQREPTKPFQVTEKVHSLALGSASDGPLLIGYQEYGVLVDIQTLAIVYDFNQNRRQEIFGNWGTRCEAAANGRWFTSTRPGYSPQGVFTIHPDGERIRLERYHKPATFVVPSPDGRYLFLGGSGVFTNTCNETNDAVFSSLATYQYFEHFYVPAHHGPYYCQIHVPHRIIRPDTKPGATVYRYGQSKPIAHLDTEKLPTVDEFRQLDSITIDKRVHLIPDARLLVVIPTDTDRLVLYPVELDAKSK
jgi:hypothetical protein